jgi:hypothetical protein
VSQASSPPPISGTVAEQEGFTTIALRCAGYFPCKRLAHPLTDFCEFDILPCKGPGSWIIEMQFGQGGHSEVQHASRNL